MKNIHEGHYAEDPIQVEHSGYSGKVYPCGVCSFASPDKNELDEHLASEAALARIKNAINMVNGRLAKYGLEFRESLLRCQSCGRPVHAANANNLQCNFCGGNLLEVGDAKEDQS